MIDGLLKIGDRVIIKIPPENRMWGYNPCPDGTRATVLSFGEIIYGRIGNLGLQPGVYENPSWARLRLAKRRIHTEATFRLTLVDKNELRRRRAELKRQKKSPDWRNQKIFLRDLPETPFWEGDTVRIIGRQSGVTVIYAALPPKQEPKLFVVVGIDYDYISKPHWRRNFAAYRISDRFDGGWHTSASEDALELVERGQVWKFFHNQPLTFADIRTEANFFNLLGHTDDVRNPANGIYVWAKEEVLEAIRTGIVHGFTMENGILGNNPSIRAVRYRNVELGQRVAQATLEGFMV